MNLDFRFTQPATAKTARANSRVRIWGLEAVLIGFKRQNFRHYVLSALLLGTVAIAGCGSSPKAAEAQSQRGAARSQGATPVEVAIATLGKVAESPEYTGSTFPDQEVSLRAQVEGRVRSLFVDVGDVVKKGQTIAQLDDTLLRTTLNQAQAELASLKAEAG